MTPSGRPKRPIRPDQQDECAAMYHAQKEAKAASVVITRTGRGIWLVEGSPLDHGHVCTSWREVLRAVRVYAFAKGLTESNR